MTYRARPGFSLIEVLIAIVVLALGLLGLASVFPVVVAQQRGVTDSVNGVSLERSAIEALENDSRLAQRSFDTGIPNGQIDPDERRGWDLLIAEPTWSRNGAWVLAEDTSGSGVIEYTPDGRIELRENNTGLSVVIPVSQRLSPVGEQLAPGTEPRYVWDFVTRRIDAGAPNVVSQSWSYADDGVQAVVFVRRIDQGIRRPSIALPGGVGAILPAAFRQGVLVPVAVSAATGLPTGDGRGDYSQVLRLTYAVPDTRVPTQITLDSGGTLSAGLRRLAAQPGQKLVDQIGVVHTVLRVKPGATPGAPPLVTLDVPISPDVERARVSQGAAELEMLFTPQVPVAVVVRTIHRRPL